MSTMAVTTTWTPARFAAAPRPSGPIFQHLADAAARGCGMGRLRIIGMEAEAAMLAATSGINTHRGAIFGLGLLCAAAGARAGGLVDPELPLGEVVSRLWGRSILDGPVLLHSHGSAARRRFRAGGARVRGCAGISERLSDRLAGLAASGVRRSRRCGSRPRRSLLCPHRFRRRHQSLASRRPRRPSLCAPQHAAFPRRGRRAQARLARARAIGPRENSSPGVSVQAARPISLR